MLIKNPEIFNGECFAFINKDIILRADHTPLTLQDLEHLKQNMQGSSIYCEPEYSICFLLVKGKELPAGYTTEALRLYNARNSEEQAMKIFRAKALASWTDSTRYCAGCGSVLTPHKELTALQCTGCGKIVFPRIEPCVIVLVRKGDKMLLARHAQRNQDIYACIAGFMEAGETAEQTVRRELMEETGITVKNIKYFGTQSWPFPSQLMIAFTAEWESGEINPQDDEISDAGWFSPDDCPATPQPGSIAYRLIHNIR